MSSDSINILAFCALCLSVSTTAGPFSQSKVAQLLREDSEKIKCFSENLRELACFWEEEEGRNSSADQYTFTYNYHDQTENKSCAVVKLSMDGAGAKPLFLCKLNQTVVFVELHLSVFKGGQELYRRTLQIERVCLLDPPANVTVVSTGEQGVLNVTWRAPDLKYIDDSLMYEIGYIMNGSPMRKETVKESTTVTLRGLQSSTKYEVLLRVKPDGKSYDGLWSSWSEPQFGTTSPSDMDPLIVVLVLIISLTLIVLSLTVILSHHKFILKKLWPEIPSPEHKFPGLFTVYKGDFQEWLGHSTGSRWPVYMYTEEIPSPLEVLSEVSVASLLPSLSTASPRTAPFPLEEPRALEEVKSHLAPQEMDAGFTNRWQEPLNTHWLMEQLRAFQDHPEVLSQSSLLESQDTYVTLNHGSCQIQRDDSLEESLPLQVLFESKDSSLSATSHSDIGSLQQSSGSGRISSQSGLDYPNHTWPPKGPGYTYMTVADSGVSMDYSPMSRIVDMGSGAVYANEYKNDILACRRPSIGGEPINSGF